MATRTDTGTETCDVRLARLRLMQLVSPSLPVGAFAYSQGIEWAVEAGWLCTAEDVEAWLSDQLTSTIARLDLPILVRLRARAAADDQSGMDDWIDLLLAGRETAQLRAEEAQRGRALAQLILAWELPGARRWRPTLARAQIAGFAFAAAAWDIDVVDALHGYAYSWLENLVLAAVKLVPLGQSAGQVMLIRLASKIPEAALAALAAADTDIGACNPALAIAASAHETQYTRLFRS